MIKQYTRSTLIERLRDYVGVLPSDLQDIAIEAVEALEAKRPGRWCFNTDGKLVCSNCYETPTNRILLYGDMIFDMTPVQEKMKFCPNCGCRMLKEGEEHEPNE